MARVKRSIKARTDVPATARGPNPDPNTYDDEDDPTPAPAAVAIPVADDDLFAVDEEVDDRPSATEGVVEGNDAEELETPKRPASKAGKGEAAVEAAATVGAAVARRVIALAPVGTRKLTKKQQTSLLDFRTMGKARDKRMDAIAKGIRDRLRTKNGFTGVYSGAESKDLVVGIPLPSLAFEFLLANDVLPLSIIIQLVAKWGTGKSGLVAEMFRWFDDAGGMGFHMENETKFSPEWFESIMGTQCFDRLTPQRATSIDDWQQRLTASIDAMKGAMDGTAADPGPGRTFPVMYSVDSIMGKLTAESQRKIAEEGFAGRGFPIEALAISRYLSSVPSWLDGWPFLLVLVNHLKVKQDDQGNKERSTAGGTATNFLETFELEMRKTKQRIACEQFDGFQVDITCQKNSLGVTHRSITTRVLWWEEPDPANPAEWKQKTVWDWDWSTIHLLHSILHVKGANPKLKKNLLEADFHLDCPSVSDIENRAWSKTLGMTKDDALPWNEVGAMIRQNAEVTNRLRHALRVKRRALLAGDYLSRQTELAGEM